MFSLKKSAWLVIALLFVMGYTHAELRLSTNREDINLNSRPDWLTIHYATQYDGETDDFVTAGIGFTPLARASIKNSFINPQKPTLHELRKMRLTRYIDAKTGEGYHYGFRFKNLTPLFDGKVAGLETLASINNGEVALLLQIPLDFDQKNPCIVAIPSTDSDGLFNAKDLQIRGLWGLNRNCAVVYNDKGMGNGFFDISQNKGYSIVGNVQGNDLLFQPTMQNAKAFSQKYPNRFAVKQLHSQQNPYAKAGEYVLKSIEFAFYQLNEYLAPTNEIIFNKNNTTVLVYGMNEGGFAALQAGEQDQDGFINGIIAVNPLINLTTNQIPLYIQSHENPKTAFVPKTTAEYATQLAIYMPCAALAINTHYQAYQVPSSNRYFYGENRCNALKNAGLLTSASLDEQTQESLEILRNNGLTKTMEMQLPHIYYTQSIGLAYRYISAYGRYGVEENLCDYSVASINQEIIMNEGNIAPLSPITFPQLYTYSKGTVPVTNGDIYLLDLVNNVDLRGARRELFTSSPSSKVVDYNLTGALCLQKASVSPRVKQGLNEASLTGKLNQIKTIIIHGQDNPINLPNNSARAYVALNSYMESSSSNLRYIEVENASMLDATAPFDHILLPIEYFAEQAADRLWGSITKKSSMPDSQIVRTQARGGRIGFAPLMKQEQFVPVLQTPKQADRIKASNGTITLP